MAKELKLFRRTFNTGRALLLLGCLAVAVTLVALCTPGPRGITDATSPPGATTAAVSDVVQIPGYGRPAVLAADPTQAGVWFLAASSTDEAIFFWNSTTSTLNRFVFATVNANNLLQFGIQAGLTVDSSGNVWLGLDTTLVHFDPSTAAFTRIAIPPVPADPSLQGGPGGGPGQPPSLYESHTVIAMTSEANGDIAMIFSNSTSVVVYNPSTGSFSTISLLNGDLPSAISTLPSGQLVVAMSNNQEVQVIGSDGTIQPISMASYNLGCGSEFCVTSPDGTNLSILTPNSSDPTSSMKVTTTSVSAQGTLQQGSRPSPLSDGRVLIPTSEGFAVMTPSTGATKNLTLPSEECSTDLIATPAPSTPSQVKCQESPVSYVVDSSGNVWFTSNSADFPVYELDSGSY